MVEADRRLPGTPKDAVAELCARIETFPTRSECTYG
ncbi:hypothetical protein R70006_02141 [Paraburkholderia domus]|nr:hypothetical protein R70006_02141 [Paraburkholderia domus]CAE6938515.1 hypothetical protein R75471_05206 [Paraburkholderia domus]